MFVGEVLVDSVVSIVPTIDALFSIFWSVRLKGCLWQSDLSGVTRRGGINQIIVNHVIQMQPYVLITREKRYGAKLCLSRASLRPGDPRTAT